MKQSLRLLVFALLTSFALNAQTASVTFQVDMTGTALEGNGPEVYIENGGQYPMTQVGSSSIYQATLDLESTVYTYAFYNGASFETVPPASRLNGSTYRYFALIGDTILEPFIFGGTAPAGKELLEFSVDLYFVTPSDLGVFVAGDFQGEAMLGNDWTPGRARMADYYPADLDQIYSIQTWVTPGTYEYKFLNGPGWPNVEVVPEACGIGANLNRQVSVAQGTPTEVLFCLSSCANSCFSVSTEDITPNNFSLMPNPAETATQVVFANPAEVYTVNLFDLTGRMVYRANNLQQSTVIQRNGLPSGLYLLQLEDTKGNIQNTRLILN